MNQGNLSRLSNALSRSISPENFTGAPGRGGMATEGTGKDCAGELGIGWKISPSIEIAPGETFTLADIDGSGAIQHIAGMESSECVIAINKNDTAAIFEVADLGIVGDVKVIIPKLIEALAKYQEENA